MTRDLKGYVVFQCMAFILSRRHSLILLVHELYILKLHFIVMNATNCAPWGFLVIISYFYAHYADNMVSHRFSQRSYGGLLNQEN